MKLSERKVRDNINKQFKGSLKGQFVLLGIEVIIMTLCVGIGTQFNAFYYFITAIFGMIMLFLVPQSTYNIKKLQKLNEEMELEKLKE